MKSIDVRSIKLTERSGKISLDKYLKDINKYVPLSTEEEIEYAKRIQEDKNDREAFEKLVFHNLRFVVSVAKRYMNRGLPVEELVNIGNEGLMKAVYRYDHTRGFKFISYAVWWIRQQLELAIMEEGDMIRIPVNRHVIKNKIHKESTKFSQTEFREPTSVEIFNILNEEGQKRYNLEDIEMLSVKNSNRVLSLDIMMSDLDSSLPDFNMHETIPSTDKNVYDITNLESVKIDIENLLRSTLSDRESEIIKMYFGINQRSMTFSEIGMKFQITTERARQVLQKALKRLRKPAKENKLNEHLLKNNLR